MFEISAQAEKANLLRSLHAPGTPLLLPNAWDVGSARAVLAAGFPVIATSSNAVAAALGYQDGEGAPVEEMVYVAQRIATCVDVPVTVDAESGYGLAPEDLARLLIDAGVVGCNIEDSDHVGGGLADVDARAAYIAQMRQAAERTGIPFVINARVDSFLPSAQLAAHRRLPDAINRARAYTTAGADCVFPIAAGPDELRALVPEHRGPVNAGLALDGGTTDELRAIGVARLSTGPQLYRKALSHLGRDLQPLVAFRE
jgi:2-methylisocitrate lyase-like PEP mutase family enzyme